ncbi:MAG: radical SAM protein, partial [Bacillota bacterium]|nr:radical SAM protein [Bacillota bacterium]
MKKRRQQQASAGRHIPGFLILSITDACNLKCRGCYARANGLCGDNSQNLLTAAQWRDIFIQGAEIGIGFMLLAGGEPLLRWDVIEAAAGIDKVVFPIFTNGTLIDDKYT